MFRTLVVPLDGSDLAERPLPYAVRFASKPGGRLVLVRVALAPLASGADWERQQLAEVEQAQTYLAGVAQKLGTLGIPIEIVTAYGRAAVEILQVTRQVNADGVVMATHGRSGLAHLTHGSVAEALLAESPVPVFLINARPGELPSAPFDPSPARLLVPLDGSNFAEMAIEAALDVIGPAGELILASVGALPDQVERDDYGRVIAYVDQQEEAATRETRDYLEGVVQQIAREHPDVRVSIDVRIGRPAEGIVLASVQQHVDLVVMSTHGRTGLRRAVFGSVAGAVLRTGSTPVLLVRPPTGARVEPIEVAASPVNTS